MSDLKAVGSDTVWGWRGLSVDSYSKCSGRCFWPRAYLRLRAWPWGRRVFPAPWQGQRAAFSLRRQRWAEPAMASGCDDWLFQLWTETISYFRKAFTQLYQNENTNNIIPSSDFHPPAFHLHWSWLCERLERVRGLLMPHMSKPITQSKSFSIG